MFHEKLIDELRSYYRTLSFHAVRTPFNPLKEKMDRFAEQNPGLSPLQLKAAQYEIIAEHFTPVLFRNDPFFYETGLKVAEYNGHTRLSSGGWLFLRNAHLIREACPEECAHYEQAGKLGLHLTYGFFDYDHHCFPFSRLLKLGLSGIAAELQEARQKNTAPAQQEFYDAALRGVAALRKTAEKFATAAREKLPSAESPEERKFLERIAATAARMPWLPPQTFYEGLALLRFFYELCSVFEGIGMSVLGAPDRMLIDLYRADLAAGRLTPEEADDLLERFLLQVDCKLDLRKALNEQFNRGEQGDTLILGGVDENGCDVSNELTSRILLLHRKLELVYPKINCRVSAATPRPFLEEIAADFLAGRNTISFFNDDLLIPAQCAAGKERRDAAGYVAGGCWEVIVEGCEHSEGANCYFSLGRVMDFSIHPDPEAEARMGLHFRKLDRESTFEAVYELCLDNVKSALGQMLEIIALAGSNWSRINPCPFFSAALAGCAQSGRDYSAGGARYNPHGVPLTGLAVYVDSLLAMKRLCFDEKIIALSDFLDAVRSNWQDRELLRRQAMESAHLGDGNGEAAALAARLLDELTGFVAGFRNERGGIFQCGLYSYVDIVEWAKLTRATPDGRHDGDFLSQGLTPSRLHRDDVTSLLRDLGSLPLEKFPANSVLTLSLSRNGLDATRFAAFLEAWLAMKASGMLQLNCVTREELEDAQLHPENHRSLLVRLYGYSAYFTSLDSERQAEFMSRTIY